MRNVPRSKSRGTKCELRIRNIKTYITILLVVIPLALHGADSMRDAAEAAQKGVAAARIAVDVAAENIANAETTFVAPNGGPYRRKFPALSETDTGVKVMGVYQDKKDPVWVYDPTHPHANAQGFVAKPNMDLAEELVRMNYYSNWLQANTAVLKRCKQMNDAVLELTR